MIKTLTWSILVAALFCGAQAVRAQGQAPAGGGEKAAPKMEKKHHGKMMEACKDDIAQFCREAKGKKAVHECLDQNKDKLSAACMEHHKKMEMKEEKGEKMEKKHKKGGKKMEKKEGEMPPAAQPAK